MSEENPFLDELIRVLDEPDNEAQLQLSPGQRGDQDNGAEVEVEHNPFLDALIEELDDAEPPDDVPGGQEARKDLARTILSSASARRKIVKPEHCQFCGSFNDVMNLRAHLENREDCFNLYCRLMHLKTIDALLSSLFTCLFCQTDDLQLASHLRSHNRCFESYCQKFCVTSIRYKLNVTYNWKCLNFSPILVRFPSK